MPFETDQRAHRHAELSGLLGTAEIGQIDDEARGEHVGGDAVIRSLSGDKRTSSGHRQVTRLTH
jgi:hypothetical protein